MQVPKLMIIDASLVFCNENEAVDPNLEVLICLCKEEGIPVYLVGSGYHYIRVPEAVRAQVSDVFRIKHCSDGVEWLRLSTLHNVSPRHMFYLSPRQPHCTEKENFGMMWIQEGVGTFVCRLKKTLTEVSRKVTLHEAFEMVGK